jgi:hypothetical protein
VRDQFWKGALKSTGFNFPKGLGLSSIPPVSVGWMAIPCGPEKYSTVSLISPKTPIMDHLVKNKGRIKVNNREYDWSRNVSSRRRG